MIIQPSFGKPNYGMGNYPPAFDRWWMERPSNDDRTNFESETAGDDILHKNKSPLPHVLVVDDDESLGHMLERAIAKLTGYDCIYVKDATLAMQVLEKSAVDVVITDIRMPGMNGMELMRRVKEGFAAAVILMTGYHDDFSYEDAIQQGANDFIEKPLRPTELIVRLKRVLKERENSTKIRQTEEELRKMNWELKTQIEEHRSELLRINALHQAEINERQQIEEELRQSRESYKLATDAAQEGLWEMDLVNRTVRWNKTFRDQFGDLSDKKLSRHWWSDRIHAEDFERIAGDFTRALEGTVTTWNQEYRFLRPDGTYAYVLNRAHIERNETGKAIKVYGAMLDITPLRQTEIELKKRTSQLERANEELESFSYSVSHDLKEPLRAIEGFSRILFLDLKDELDNEAKRKFDVIREKTRKMAQLIENILIFSRLGLQEITVTFNNWEKLVGDVWQEVLDRDSERNVKFTISPLAACYGDENMMRQVFTNLLSNALKFTKGRNPAIIEVGCEEKKDEYIYYVKDNGIGFDMRFSYKLFKIFNRLHSDKEFAGTGIGLSFVKRIIERHGGRVWAGGKVNEGATFYFTLPKHIR